MSKGKKSRNHRGQFAPIVGTPPNVLRLPDLGVKVGFEYASVSTWIQTGVKDPNFDEKIAPAEVWVADINDEDWEGRAKFATPWFALAHLRKLGELPRPIMPYIDKERSLFLTYKGREIYFNLNRPLQNLVHLLRWIRFIAKDLGATREELRTLFDKVNLGSKYVGFMWHSGKPKKRSVDGRATKAEAEAEAEAQVKPEEADAKKDGKEVEEVDVTKVTLESLGEKHGLDTRTINAFSKVRVKAIGDVMKIVAKKGRSGLLELEDIGEGSVRNLFKALEKAKLDYAVKEPASGKTE